MTAAATVLIEGSARKEAAAALQQAVQGKGAYALSARAQPYGGRGSSDMRT